MLLPQTLDSLSPGNSSYSISTWIKSGNRTVGVEVEEKVELQREMK